MYIAHTISKICKIVLLFFVLTGCSDSTITSSGIDSNQKFPITVYIAKDGNLEIINYEMNALENVKLKMNIFNKPYYRGEYSEIIKYNNSIILSGYSNIVILDENRTLEYLDLEKTFCSTLYGKGSNAGANRHSIAYDGENIYFIQYLGTNEQQRNVLGLNTPKECIVIDENVGIDSFVYIENNKINVLLRELYASDLENDEIGNTIIHRIYDLEGNEIEISRYVLDIDFGAMYNYFQHKESKYFHLISEEESILVQIDENDRQYIKYPRNEFYYSPSNKDENFKIVDDYLYLFKGDSIDKIDLNSFRIEQSFSLETDSEEEFYARSVKFGDKYFYVIADKDIYCYDLEKFSLAKKVKHSIKFDETIPTSLILENSD
ncbi:MAG: hypothetical protein VB122_00940 [Erysipelotrichales bacterium]|nr:hypothetical protein [Erysipelotrichales bacterium]